MRGVAKGFPSLFNIVRTIKTVAKRTVIKDWDAPVTTYWYGFWVVLAVLIIGTLMQLAQFPWNGNPVTWYQANKLFEQALVAEKRQDTAIAMSKLREAIRTYPGDKRFYAELATQQTHQSAVNDAIQSWEHCLQLDKNQPRVWISLAQLQLVAGDTEKAGKAIDHAVQLDEASADAHAMKALILLNGSKPSEAADEFARTEKLERDNARFWNFAGSYYAQIGKSQEAEVALRQACDLEPTNAMFQNSLGSFLLRAKKFAEAETYLSHAARLQPDNSSYWTALAQASYANKNNKQAINALAKASQLKPSDWRRLEQLGTLQMAEKDYNGAVESFRRATEIVPERRVLWDALVKALFLAGRFPEAKVTVVRFMNLSAENEQNPVAWQYLGQLLQKEGANGDAKSAYKRAIQFSKNQQLTAFCNGKIAELDKKQQGTVQ